MSINNVLPFLPIQLVQELIYSFLQNKLTGLIVVGLLFKIRLKIWNNVFINYILQLRYTGAKETIILLA